MMELMDLSCGQNLAVTARWINCKGEKGGNNPVSPPPPLESKLGNQCGISRAEWDEFGTHESRKGSAELSSIQHPPSSDLSAFLSAFIRVHQRFKRPLHWTHSRITAARVCWNPATSLL
jgi:hypothetical protein